MWRKEVSRPDAPIKGMNNGRRNKQSKAILLSTVLFNNALVILFSFKRVLKYKGLASTCTYACFQLSAH